MSIDPNVWPVWSPGVPFWTPSDLAWCRRIMGDLDLSEVREVPLAEAWATIQERMRLRSWDDVPSVGYIILDDVVTYDDQSDFVMATARMTLVQVGFVAKTIDSRLWPNIQRPYTA